MKIRIFVYGLLILAICLLTTLYLVYTNQNRILEAARYKLSALAREKWAVNLLVENSQLNLYRNAVVFRNISIGTEDETFSLKIAKLEMVYSLERLFKGDVHFKKIHLEMPILEVRLPEEVERGKAFSWLTPEKILATLSVVERVDVEKGVLIFSGPERDSLQIDGFGLQMLISKYDVNTRVWINRLKVDYDIYHFIFDEGFIQGTLDREGFGFRRVDLSGETGSIKLSGRLGRDRSLAADFSLEGDLGKFQHSVKGLIPLAGRVEAQGKWTLGAAAPWSVEGRVRTQGLAVAGEPIPNSTASVSLRQGRCFFSGIESPVAPGGRLKGTCELTWSPERFDYAFTVMADEAKPEAVAYVRKHFPIDLLGSVGPVSGIVDCRSSLPHGGKSRWEVNLDLRGPMESYLGSHAARVTGQVDGTKGEPIALKDFKLEAGPLKASWAGTLDEIGGASVAVIVETENLAESLAPFGLGRIGGRGSFAGDVTGSIQNPALSGGLMMEEVTVKEVPLGRAWGRLRYREGTLWTEGLNLEKGTTSLVVSGSASVKDDRFISATISLGNVALADAREIIGLELPLDGAVSGSVLLSGPAAGLSGSARLTSGEMKAGGVLLSDVAADFSFNPASVYFKNLEALYAGGRSFFSGQWQADGELKGRIKGQLPSLEAALGKAALGGSLEYAGEISGRWLDPDFKGSLQWRGVRLYGAGYPDISLEVEKKGGRLVAEGLFMEHFPLRLELGTGRPYPLRGRLSFDSLDLTALHPYLAALGLGKTEELLKSYRGTAVGLLEFQVPLAAPESFTGKVLLQKLELVLGREISRLSEPAEIAFSRSGVRVEKAAFEGNLHRLSLEGGVDGGRLALSLKGILNLGFLLERVPAMTSVDVTPEISLAISGTVSSPQISGSARFEGGSFNLAGLKIPVEDLAGEVEFDRQTVELKTFSASIGRKTVRGDGRYQINEKGGRLRLRGSFPLSALDFSLPGVKEYSGDADFDVILSGAVANPGLEADVSVKGGLVRLADIQTPLKDVSLTLSVNDEYIRVREASATFNGGGIRGSGYLVWPRGGGPEDVNLDLWAENLYWSFPGTLKMVTSADVNLRGSPDDWLLKGQLVLERGKYFRDMAPRPVLTFNQATGDFLREKVRRNRFLSHLRLDVRILGEEGFWIDNNVAQINAGLDVRLRGTVTEPIISGEARVLQGSIFYLGKKFKLGEASVVFPEKYPPDPYLNIEAQTTVASVSITLAAQGNLSALELDLYSDPPYSREDIISLLTLGAPRALLQNKGRDVSAVGAVMVFSGALIDRLEDQARTLTGLEVFQIEPTLSDTGGAARLVVGKQLSDRIFLSYSRNLTTSGDDQFSMEYQLLDFLALVGKQDRLGVYSFDIVFTYEGLEWFRD